MSKFSITRCEKSRLSEIDLQSIDAKDFGRIFTDHMFIAEYANGAWSEGKIVPYGKISVSPSLSAIHYGQAIFEGMKAHRLEDGGIGIFRLQEHFQRLNRSAARLCMPTVPEHLFCDGLQTLLDLDRSWFPNEVGSGLYLRPFLFASDEQILAAPSKNYTFCILLTPIVSYLVDKSLNILAENSYSRSANGGVGFAKAAGNYAAGFMPIQKAQTQGFDQVLWLDAETHTLVQECGVMNVMFLIGDTFITPSIEGGTILAGINRDSVIQLLREAGKKVEERDISLQEIISAQQNGSLLEILGMGTAVSVAFVKSIAYRDQVVEVKNLDFPEASKIKEWIYQARVGSSSFECCKNWLTRI